MNINIRNQSLKAEEIGLQQLNSLISSVGLTSITDSDELLNCEMQIKVAIKAAKDGYDARNEVKAFKALERGYSSTPYQQPPSPPAQEQSSAQQYYEQSNSAGPDFSKPEPSPLYTEQAPSGDVPPWRR